MPVEVAQFLCLNDNFGLLVRDIGTGATASVDAPDGAAIIREAERRGWTLTHLLLTHHHADHVQGTEALRARNPDLLVAGAAGDAHLEFRGNLDEAHLSIGTHEELAIGEPLPQPVVQPLPQKIERVRTRVWTSIKSDK